MERTTTSKDIDGIKTSTNKERTPGKMLDLLHMELMVLRWRRKFLERVRVSLF